MNPKFDNQGLPVLNSVKRALHRYDISRTHLYALLRDGEITAVKAGKRTLIPEASLREWASRLPVVKGGKEAA